MKETEQTLLESIKNDVAKEQFPELGNWYRLDPPEESVCWPIVCERFATAKAQASCEEHVWNTHVVPLQKKVKDLQRVLDIQVQTVNDALHVNLKQENRIRMELESENKSLREEIERLKIERKYIIIK